MAARDDSSKPIIVSIASGKGGVGKSAVACNLALAVARRGRRVVLADLDVGGANLHVMLGQFHPPRTLTDFLTHTVRDLAEVLQPVDFCPQLQLLPGTGESIETANPRHASKQRLLRELAKLDTEIVLVDIGAGASYNTLDFFIAADLQVAVAPPEPASVIDVYTFLKLAVIRLLQGTFGSRDAVSIELARRDFRSLAATIETAGAGNVQAASAARAALARFRPLLLLNRVSPATRLNIAHLNRTLKQYVGNEVALLGEVPEDDAVAHSLRVFTPVLEHAPRSPAAVALARAAEALLHAIDARQAAAAASPTEEAHPDPDGPSL